MFRVGFEENIEHHKFTCKLCDQRTDASYYLILRQIPVVYKGKTQRYSSVFTKVCFGCVSKLSDRHLETKSECQSLRSE